jgi:hypothetical protein
MVGRGENERLTGGTAAQLLTLYSSDDKARPTDVADLIPSGHAGKDSPLNMDDIAAYVRKMPELSPDVLRLVFQELAGDSETLLNVSLTCSAWRSLALPSVYRVIDISSHNNGLQPQLERDMSSPVYADYDGRYRPQNLVSRQRAFLRLMVAKPLLAKYVRSFTWTLIWLDFDEQELTGIDLQTWDVFARLVNVTQLDLASLHRNGDDEYVRRNPAVLFPKVRDLRLLGWMHRSLVRAIIMLLDSCKLQSLKLDYLEDEDAYPNGESLGQHAATRLAQQARATNTSVRPNPMTTDGSDVYHDDLILRQETGKAFVFPGPMWLPLYLLSAHAMDSLTHFQVKVPPFDLATDLRNYQTLFRQTASLVVKARGSLRSLMIVFGVRYERPYTGWCGNGRRQRAKRQRWCITMAKLFLEQMLAALNENAFPHLEHIHFEGFVLLKVANLRETADADLTGLFWSIEECRFTNASFVDVPNVQNRRSWHGHDRPRDPDHRFDELLASSWA